MSCSTSQKFTLESIPSRTERRACETQCEPKTTCVKTCHSHHEESKGSWGFWIGLIVIWWLLIVIAWGCFGGDCGNNNSCRNDSGCRREEGGFGFGFGGGWWWLIWIWFIVIIIAFFWWGGNRGSGY